MTIEQLANEKQKIYEHFVKNLEVVKESIMKLSTQPVDNIINAIEETSKKLTLMETEFSKDYFSLTQEKEETNGGESSS
ncbi:MAG: hypothetical protein ACTSYC_08620 [Promethearchaeota archaeon]